MSKHRLNIIKKLKKDCNKAVKGFKIFLKKKKKKSNNMVVSITKISQKMKSKSLLSIEENITEREKMPYYNYKKLLF